MLNLTERKGCRTDRTHFSRFVILRVQATAAKVIMNTSIIFTKQTGLLKTRPGLTASCALIFTLSSNKRNIAKNTDSNFITKNTAAPLQSTAIIAAQIIRTILFTVAKTWQSEFYKKEIKQFLPLE